MICSICLFSAIKSPEKACYIQKRVFEEKTPKFFKETWFDEELENLLRERQLAYEKYSKISSPESWSAYC